MVPKTNGSSIQVLVIYPEHRLIKGKDKFIKEHYLKKCGWIKGI